MKRSVKQPVMLVALATALMVTFATVGCAGDQAAVTNYAPSTPAGLPAAPNVPGTAGSETTARPSPSGATTPPSEPTASPPPGRVVVNPVGAPAAASSAQSPSAGKPSAAINQQDGTLPPGSTTNGSPSIQPPDSPAPTAAPTGEPVSTTAPADPSLPLIMLPLGPDNGFIAWQLMNSNAGSDTVSVLVQADGCKPPDGIYLSENASTVLIGIVNVDYHADCAGFPILPKQIDIHLAAPLGSRSIVHEEL